MGKIRAKYEGFLEQQNEFSSIKLTNHNVLTSKSHHIFKSSTSIGLGWFDQCQANIRGGGGGEGALKTHNWL